MRTCGYAIYTDGSNDNGIKKMMLITVSILDGDQVTCQFLDICMSESSTAKGKPKQ